MSSTSQSPNWREIISARSTITGKQEYLTSTNGALNVNGSGGGGLSNVNLTQVNGASISLGQTTKSASLPVTLASDQGTLAISGTVTANIGTADDIFTNATATGGTQQTKITDGTNIVGVLKSDGTIASAQNAQLVSGARQEQASLTAGSLNADLVPSTDVSNYRYGSVQITGTWSGTLTFQGSNDGTNFFTINTLGASGSASGFSTGTTTANTTQQFPIFFRFLRVRMTAYTSGTANGTLELFTLPPVANSSAVAQQGTWNVGASSATGSAIPANAFMIGLSDGTNLVAARQASNGLNASAGGLIASNMAAQFDDVSPTSITENNFGNLRISQNRNLYSTIRDAAGNERGANVTAANELVVSDSGLRPAGTSLNTYSAHITTNATNTPTASTAYISSIAISNEVGGTTSTVTIQDKQGTPLKLVSGLATTALTTVPTVINFQTPIKMVSGIDVITAGAVAATVDVWIDYFQ